MQRNGGKSGTELAAALGVDMAKWWAPTPETFLSVVSKPVLAAAVADVGGKTAGEQLLPMKKDAAIAAAAQHLAGKGWLPKPLRGPGYALKAKTESKQATHAPAKAAGKSTKKAAGDKKPKPATKKAAKAAKKAPAKKARGKA
jgi:ParB family chromosome partitioning protein